MEDAAVVQAVSRQTGLPEKGVRAVLTLEEDGATVPFIARYRKEQTGALDENEIRAILEANGALQALEQRRAAILSKLSDAGVLSKDLKGALEGAGTLSELEDIYLPYRPKRKTRADIAREQGLAPLADALLSQDDGNFDERVHSFIDPEKGLSDSEAVLGGVRDILAQGFSESPDVRSSMRRHFQKRSVVASSKVEKACQKDPEKAAKFKDYFSWTEPASRAAGHRILALRRGAAQGFLRWHILPDEEDALLLMKRLCMRKGGPGPEDAPHIPLHGRAARELAQAVSDSYRRLLAPSLENEYRKILIEAAEKEAIDRFSSNVRELLLQAPFGGKPVLAVDPGLRTGCKIAVLSAEGDLMEEGVIYPLPPRQRREEAAERVLELIREYRIEALAVGNGTGGRESLAFLSGIGIDPSIPLVSVDESGASVYSASPLAGEEFPNYDLTVRGTVSIGRRLQDPLAELVKIDPEAIGVGQYQHDVNAKALKAALDTTVESCVNSVGVELNSASERLLSYVSGINGSLAKRIVDRRREAGPFRSRKELLQVKGLGAKAFEQSAGFLRIRNADYPLDRTAVHPERYTVLERIARDAKVELAELLGSENDRRAEIDFYSYSDEQLGKETITDILKELEKPGRDPRRAFSVFSFADGVNSIADLSVGMELPGIVTNITAFGAFVDIGVHQDGLVHISEMADHFVKDPADELHLRQEIQVRIISLDPDRKRIGLSMRSERRKD